MGTRYCYDMPRSSRCGVPSGAAARYHRRGTADTCPVPQRGNCMADLVSHDILVPTDFSSGSRLALERARRSLGPEGGTICILHVLDQHLIAQMQALVPDLVESELRARIRQQAETHYAHLVAGLARDNVTLAPMIVEGAPFLKIVQLAHDLDVDMIVMTVHRSVPHIEQVLFGSTAERVLRLAPCPVLMVPEVVAPPPAPAGEVDHHPDERTSSLGY